MIAVETMQETESPCQEEISELLYKASASLFPTLSFSPYELAAEEVTFIDGTVTVSF